jgi:minor curlin subunit
VIINKLNKIEVRKSNICCIFPVIFVIQLIFCSYNTNANDLLSGSELKDSPLSLSLTTTAVMTIDDQTQQLVINQYGIHNKATVNQMTNAGNSIAINQDGMDNLANLLQTGYGNTINLHQQGNSNFAEVIQEGNTNLVNIVQEGEQTFIVHQIGNDMVVNITQY